VSINGGGATPSYYNKVNGELSLPKGFQRQTYSWLAQQPAEALMPNPEDVLIIETQINPDAPIDDEPQGRVNPNIPAVCPLKESPQSSFWALLKTNPVWQHTKQWGLYTGGVALGTVAMSGLLGNGQQLWKATTGNAKVQELKVASPASWWAAGAKKPERYQALVTLPDNPWDDPHALYLSIQPNTGLQLEANGKPALRVEKQYIGDDKRVGYEVKFFEAKALNEGSDVRHTWHVEWDAMVKKIKIGDNQKQLIDKLEAPLADCLAWLHEPEALKKGLKQDLLFAHFEGLKGSVGVAFFLAGLSAVAGAALWQFHKRPKPVKAQAMSLDKLPAA
jgi:hypothetical protein